VGKPRVAYKQSVAQEAIGQGVFDRLVAGRALFGRVKLRVAPMSDLVPVVVNKLDTEPDAAHLPARPGCRRRCRRRVRASRSASRSSAPRVELLEMELREGETNGGRALGPPTELPSRTRWRRGAPW
jgi:hypothetical protein